MSDFEPAKYLAPRDSVSAKMEEEEMEMSKSAMMMTMTTTTTTSTSSTLPLSPDEIGVEAKSPNGFVSPDESNNKHRRQASKTSLSEFIPGVEEDEVEEVEKEVDESDSKSTTLPETFAGDASSQPLPPPPLPSHNKTSREDRKSAYNLYGISCHNGILGGGHYVSYAQNSRSKKW